MFTLLIAVTYKCNADCEFCYTKNFKKNFKKDMDFFTFLDIINKFIKNKGKKITLIGGEPTIWKHVNKAIIYCKLRNVKVSLATNGLNYTRFMPDKVFMSISHILEKEKEDKIIESLNHYKKKGVELVFRYNISLSSSEEELSEIIRLANKYKVSYIDVDPLVPYEIEKPMGQKLFNVIKGLRDKGIRCILGNPVPPCMFDKYQIEYLRKNARIYYVCNAGKYMLIHPDGKTIQPCSKMFLPKKIEDLKGDYSNLEGLYGKDMNKILNNVPHKCKYCDYFKDKKCFGGCVTFRAQEMIKNKELG